MQKAPSCGGQITFIRLRTVPFPRRSTRGAEAGWRARASADRPMRRQLDRIDDDRDHACGAGKEEAPVRRGMNSPSHLPPPTAIPPARDRLLVSLKCNGRFSIETNDSGTTAPGSGVHVRLSPSLPPSLSLRGCRLGRYASPDGVFDGVAFDLCVVDFRARDCGCAAVWHHQFTT